MSSVRLVNMKFKPGKKQIWLDWCEQLKSRSNEVIETLRNEGGLVGSLLSRTGKEKHFFTLWKLKTWKRRRRHFKTAGLRLIVSTAGQF